MRTDIQLSDVRTDIKLSDVRTDIQLSDVRTDIQLSDVRTDIQLSEVRTDIQLSDVRTDVQVEIIDLQCDSNLTENLASVGLEIHKYLLPGYPKLRDLAAKMSCIFATTYLCKQVFSVVSINKNRLTSKDINDVLKLAASQKISHDINALVNSKRCQASGSI